MAYLNDVHCHLEVFQKEGILEELLEKAREHGIRRWITSVISEGDWELSQKIRAENEGLYLAAGFHPYYLSCWDEMMGERLYNFVKINKIEFIGEIGLDKSRTSPDFNLQKKSFIEQIEIANLLKIPVVIHGRNAFPKILAVFSEEKKPLFGGILHSYSGSEELIKPFRDLGFYFSFSGTSTYPQNKKARENLIKIPPEWILTETDAPDLPPVDFYGQVCYPHYMINTVKFISEIKNIEFEKLKAILEKNFLSFFPY